MEQVQTATRRLADRVSAEVVALWRQAEDGTITGAQFRALAAAAIARANAQGLALADLGLTAEVARQLGRAVRPLGIHDPVALDQERIDRALGQALASDDDPDGLPVRLDQIARSETYLTVANGVQGAMAGYGATGWTRRLSGTSCPLCARWADGVVRPPGTRMARHIGCDCIQTPVFA